MHGVGKARSIRSQSGFTLLEMIVAVTLVAMMAVGLWAVFRISVRSWSRGTEFMDTNQHNRSILDLVRKQLASAHGLFVPDPEQLGNSFLPFSGNDSSLHFISLSSLRFRDNPGLTWVSYAVDQGSNGEYALVERETRYLGRMPDEDISAIGSKAIPIFQNLSSCLFEYFDSGDSNNPPSWVREWDGKKLNRMPLAVSLTMISRDPKGNTLNRHIVIPIKAESSDARYNFVNPFGPTRGM
jgi:prepilin-type N-terminal cleavage/methylation domain-containing protein